MSCFKYIIFSLFASCVLYGETCTDCSREFESVESLAIQTGLQNPKLGNILISDVVDAGAAQVAYGIGSAHATGSLGELGHKAVHGALAVTGAKLTGRDPVGAAVGAVVAETAAEALHKDGKDPAKTADQARLIANTVAFLAGQDVASADAAAQNAIENNWWWTLDAYHYGKIYAESGKEGVIEEIKEHPVEAALAAGGLGWVGRVGKGAKALNKLAKAEKFECKTQAVQQEFKFVQELQPTKKVESVVNAAPAATTTKVVATEAKPILGGSYAEVRKANTGGEVHHIPADSASSIPRDKGPAVWMEAKDHWRTGSHPRTKHAKQYRNQQKILIEQGNYRGALSKDFWDIHGKCGTKYNEGFKQVIEYAEKLPEFRKGGK